MKNCNHKLKPSVLYPDGTSKFCIKCYKEFRLVHKGQSGK